MRKLLLDPQNKINGQPAQENEQIVFWKDGKSVLDRRIQIIRFKMIATGTSVGINIYNFRLFYWQIHMRFSYNTRYCKKLTPQKCRVSSPMWRQDYSMHRYCISTRCMVLKRTTKIRKTIRKDGMIMASSIRYQL